MALIETRGLTKRYGPVTALDSIDLDVPPGVVGLVGANGAGKSTVIKILLGLLAPTEGSATVLGLDSRDDALEIRTRVGYMPEHDCLPGDVSATDLLVHLGRMSGLPRTVARERAADTLRHVGLFEERYRLVGGYSTGMRQRVKLAQALVHDPKLLLLDEPTNGLDPSGRDEMLSLIARVSASFGIPVLLTSHLLGELEKVSDHIIVIDGGRLLRSSSTADLTTSTTTLAVEVTDRADEVAARLSRAGFAVQRSGHLVLVQQRDGLVEDAVRDAVVAESVGLIRLQPRQHRLQEVFSAAQEVVDV